MNDSHLQACLNLLQQATQELKDLLENPVSEPQNREKIDQIQTQIHQALIRLNARVQPVDLSHIPPEILQQVQSLGLPLESLEIQLALSRHHLSQILGILTEIQNKSEQIRNRRDYFLDRLPQMPIEKLGPRVPIVTEADFLPDYDPLPKEKREELKAKYKIDQLIQKRKHSRSSLFAQIKQAQSLVSLPTQPLESSSEFEEDLPF